MKAIVRNNKHIGITSTLLNTFLFTLQSNISNNFVVFKPFNFNSAKVNDILGTKFYDNNCREINAMFLVQ